MPLNEHDPRPQGAAIRNRATANGTAPVGTYTDTSLTKANVDQAMPSVLPNRSGARTLGNIRPVYASDRVQEIDQTATNESPPPTPHSKPKWEIETTADDISRAKDPYRNDGMISQNDMFKNQG